MAKTAVIAVRIDPDTKEKVEKLYASFGLTISDAINMFIHQSLNVRGLPFELKEHVIQGEYDFDSDSFKEDILNIDELKTKIRPVAEKYAVNNMYLFGSRARKDNRIDSDYDFCVDMDKPCSLLKWSGLKIDLESLLKHDVDLIDRTVLDDEFKKTIESEGVCVYER